MRSEQITHTASGSDLLRRQKPNNSPRVLIISGQSAGGIWHYACLLSKALGESGVDVALATTFPFEPLKDIADVQIWPLGTQPARIVSSPFNLLRHAVSQADKLRRLHQLIMKFRPGVLHLQDRMGQLDFLYLKLLKWMGVKVVFTAHDPRPLFGKSSWLDRARFHEADAILVHSTNGVQELVADGVDASKITQIAHPNYLHFCDPHDLSRDGARQLLGIPLAARSILFFGRITSYKGLDVLIRAFSSVSNEDPRAYLTIAGAPAEDFKPYQLLIGELGLTDRVLTDLRYIPFEEFSKYFCSADVVVLPYRRIHQSGVLQLAYGFGRPVVVTDVGGLSEVVAEDHTGAIVSAGDSNGLASAMRQLLDDPGSAEEMGRRGRRLAETKYPWSAIAEEVGKVYQSIYRRASITDRRTR